MNAIVRNYANMEHRGSVVFAKEYADFPETPTRNELAVVNGVMWMYSMINGTLTWYPFNDKKKTYVHTQILPSSDWVVQHNLDSQDFVLGIYNAQNNLMSPSGITQVEDDSFHVTFTEPVAGRVVAFFDTDAFAPKVVTQLVEADEFNIGGGSVTASEDGLFVGANRVVDQSVVGQANGVAPLNAEGKVPSSMVDGGSGGAANILVGTGVTQRDTTKNGMFAGVDGGGDPTLTWINKDAPAGKHVVQAYVTDDGVWRLALSNDTITGGVGTVMTVGRTGNTVDSIGLSATTISLNGAVAGLTTLSASGLVTAGSFKGDGSQLTALSAAALSAGQVPVARMGTGTADGTTFLSGDGTWKAVAASGSVLNATDAVPAVSVSASAVTAGVTSSGSNAVMNWIHSGAAANTRVMYQRLQGTGAFDMGFVTDTGTTPTAFFSVSRPTGSNSANAITFASTSFTVNAAMSAKNLNLTDSAIPTNGLYLAGTNLLGLATNGTASLFINQNGAIGLGGANFGTSGQVLTSNGTGAPTWSAAPASTTLNGTGLIQRGTSSSVVAAGLDGGDDPVLSMFNKDAPANNRWSHLYVTDNGNLRWTLGNDAINTDTPFLLVTRNLNAAATLTLTGTAIGLTGATTVTGNLTVAGAGVISGIGSGLTTLNAAALSSGLVPVARMGSGTADGTTFLRGDGTWAAPTATVSSLVATADAGFASTAPAVYVGVSGTVPVMNFVNSAAGANGKVTYARHLNTGVFEMGASTDAGASPVPWLSVARSGTTASTLTLTATAIALTGAVTATSLAGAGSGITALNASNLGSGTVPMARLGLSGTPDSTTYLRGDGQWAVPAGNGGGSTKLISSTGGIVAGAVGTRIKLGAAATIPASTFAVDDWFSLFNTTGSPITITPAAGLTVRRDGSTAASGPFIMPAYATVFVWWISTTEVLISGTYI